MALHHLSDREHVRSRETAKWAMGVALFASLTAALFSLQLFQMSSEGTAHKALERAIDALAEGDAVIARNHDALMAAADASAPGAAIPLDDYPVAVSFSPDEIRGSDVAGLHALALRRATDTVYADGAGAIRDDEATGSPGRFSSAGAVDEFLGLLTNGTHDTLVFLTPALILLSAILALALALACHGYGRVGAPGVALLAASGVLVAAGGAAWLYANSASGADDYVRRELMAIAEELALLPLRNGGALAALGAVLIVAAMAGSRLASASGRRSAGVS